MLPQSEIYNAMIQEHGKAAFHGDFVQDRLQRFRIQYALKHLPATGDMLDIGCGFGEISAGIAKSVSGTVLALDVSSESLRLTEELGHTRSNLQYQLGTIEALNGSRCFDGCSLFEVFEHVEDPDTLIRQIYTRLKPGGILVMSTPNWRSLGRCVIDPVSVNFLRICRKLLYPHKPFEWWKDSVSSEHVREYRWAEVVTTLKNAGFTLIDRDGLALHNRSLRLFTRMPRLLTLALGCGRLWPRRAHHMYFAARKPK